MSAQGGVSPRRRRPAARRRDAPPDAGRRAGRVRRRALISLAVAAACALAVVLSLAVWAFGIANYGEDFCAMRAFDRPEVHHYSGPAWVGPVTLRCSYAGQPDEFVRDWRPLLWSAGWVVACAATVALILRAGVRAARAA